MEKLTDSWKMTFGKYEGTELANVPASYLIWAYENLRDLRSDLRKYIEDNMDDLKQEVKSGKK